VDPQAVTLGEHQQLGVEEPAVVLDERQQRPRDVGADRLEAALGVAEPGPQDRSQEVVVGARDQLALEPAGDPRAARQPAADRELAVARDQRRDQRSQRPQVGRQVDVHVAEDVGLAGRPGGPQRPAAALGVEVAHPHARQLGRQPAGDGEGRVDAGVVGDHDPPAVRQLATQEGVQRPDRALQPGLLVVDRDDHLDQRPVCVPVWHERHYPARLEARAMNPVRRASERRRSHQARIGQ
jgi:hypothetical protein